MTLDFISLISPGWEVMFLNSMVRYLYFAIGSRFARCCINVSCIHSKQSKLFQNYWPMVTDIPCFGQRLGSSPGHTREFCPNLVLYRFKSMFSKESLQLPGILRWSIWGAVLLFIKYFLISRNRILDIKKSNSWYQEIFTISWYQEIEFLISRNRFFDIKKLIFWFQEFDFLISRNKFHFLISRIIFLDIKKWILDIKKYLINSKTVPLNTFLDIKNLISWYQELISWYQELISWYQEMCIISWYQEIEFLISRYAFLDIKNSISWYQDMHFLYQEFLFWYQKIDFLISRNIYYFFISRNRILDIKKSISWYQKIFLDIKKYFLISRIHFLISRNRFLDIKKCWINSKTAPHRSNLQTKAVKRHGEFHLVGLEKSENGFDVDSMTQQSSRGR